MKHSLQKNSGFRQGKFTPKHPEKYLGNSKDILYRSSWELRFCQFLDNNPNILKWGCEEISIPYIKPTTGKVHKYYVDFYIEYINKNNEVVHELVEIKPSKQLTRSTARKHKTRLYEDITYAINTAKWDAAQKFATNHGWKFRLLTEEQLFKH